MRCYQAELCLPSCSDLYHSDTVKAQGIDCFMKCGDHIVSNDVTELSTRTLASACIPPLSKADVLRFDVFQFNANLREAYAGNPELLVHCPVSY
jgi:hypothetical protein